MGYRAARWMDQMATDFDKAKAKIPADKVDNTGLEVVNQSNLAEFEKRHAEWKK
jgi:hypothetical protein